MIEIIKQLFTPGDSSSWVHLDERMRFRLRLWGVVSVFCMCALVVGSLYTYSRWPPIRAFLDSIMRDVQSSVKTQQKIPEWVVTVSGIWVSILVVVSSFFFWLLVDLGKMHYRLDRATFRLIRAVTNHIRSTMLERLGCPQTTDCFLRQLTETRAGVRQFMTDVFYHFANADAVGTHNQKDKRQQVFNLWTDYYVFNYIMLIAVLMWLWVCLLVLIKVASWPALSLVIPTVVIGWIWRSRGVSARAKVIELAGDQIRAFFLHATQDVQAQAGSLVTACAADQCRLRAAPNLILAP